MVGKAEYSIILKGVPAEVQALRDVVKDADKLEAVRLSELFDRLDSVDRALTTLLQAADADVAPALAHLVSEFRHNAAVVRVMRRSGRKEYPDYLIWVTKLRDTSKLITGELEKIGAFLDSETARLHRRSSDLVSRSQRPTVSLRVDQRKPADVPPSRPADDRRIS